MNNSKFTIVTALLDIDRSKWNNFYKRDITQYFDYLYNVINLDCNFYIFMDSRYVDFFKTIIKEKPNIFIKPVNISELSLYKYKDRIKDIMENNNYNNIPFDTSLSTTTCPELTIPEYNIVVNSKVEFIKLAYNDNIYNSDYFLWIDSGYGHSKINIPKKWNPPLTNKIGILCLQHPKNIPNDYMLFFKQHVDIVNGGYICIHKDNINMYHDMYYNTVKKYLDLGITDDDQYIASMC